MQETSFDNLLRTATDAQQAQQEWHHHYLPPGCLLNTTDKHALILEISDNDAKVSYFDSKPLEKLELLENLFFNR